MLANRLLQLVGTKSAGHSKPLSLTITVSLFLVNAQISNRWPGRRKSGIAADLIRIQEPTLELSTDLVPTMNH